MTRQSDLAKIHIAKKDLGLDESTYRSILHAVCRTDSSATLDAAGRQALLDHFKARGWKPTGQRRRDIVDKIRALWWSMHQRGLINDGSDSALNAWVARQTASDNGKGIESAQWLRRDKAAAVRVYEALKAWNKRPSHAQ